MTWRRLAGTAWLALLLSACGSSQAGIQSNTTASPTPTATPTAQTGPSANIPTFASAQLAANYGVEEYEILRNQGTGFNGPIIVVPAGCTPQAYKPCLIGGSLIMGDHAAYGQFSDEGVAGGAACFAYVFQDASGWHSMDAVCTQNTVQPSRGSGDIVQVSSGCANVRQTPGLNGAVVACLTNLTDVTVDDGPNYVVNTPGQIGYLWWHLAGKGWMAHQFLINLQEGPCQEPQCGLQAATCPASYKSSVMLIGSNAFHSTKIYDNFPLPPLTSKLENNAAGFLGTMLCSAGTLAEVTAFMQVQLDARGFQYTGSTACKVATYSTYECWSAGGSAQYDFVLGFNSATDWFAGFHNPDNHG